MAATRAKDAISVLVPSTQRYVALPRTSIAATVAVLRDAFRVATNAIQNFSSQQSLDNMRREVGTALLGLSHALEDEPLTQETIDRAKYAVEAWLKLAKK